MERRAAGPCAWLMEGVAEPAAWAASLRSSAIGGVIDIVPAERTVFVVCDRERSEAIGRLLDGVTVGSGDGTTARTVTIDVVYDGPDLSAVAASTGLDVESVIRRHVSGVYTVAFCGFSPGFAYMTGLDTALQIPRRDTPRTTVPEGSVAIAAGYTSVYPSSSPGGWHLLGSTSAVLWDVSAADPALLTPGTTVRFVQVHV